MAVRAVIIKLGGCPGETSAATTPCPSSRGRLGTSMSRAVSGCGIWPGRRAPRPTAARDAIRRSGRGCRTSSSGRWRR